MTEVDFHQALKEGDLIKARKVLRDLEGSLPRTRSLFLQGILLEKAGDHSGAVKKYDLALVTHLSDPDIWFAKARALDRMGRRDMAKRAVERAIKLSPRDPEPRVLHGRLLLNLKAYDRAMTEAIAALEAAPENTGALLLYGILLSLIEQDYLKALAQFDKVLALDEDNSEAWTNRGIVLRQIGDRDGSLYSLKRALTLDPGDNTARQMLVTMGRKDLAGSIRLMKAERTKDDRSDQGDQPASHVDEGDDAPDVPDANEGSPDREGGDNRSEGPDGSNGDGLDRGIELVCPRCGRSFEVRSRGRFGCPGCGLQGEVD